MLSGILNGLFCSFSGLDGHYLSEEFVTLSFLDTGSNLSQVTECQVNAISWMILFQLFCSENKRVLAAPRAIQSGQLPVLSEKPEEGSQRDRGLGPFLVTTLLPVLKGYSTN